MAEVSNMVLTRFESMKLLRVKIITIVHSIVRYSFLAMFVLYRPLSPPFNTYMARAASEPRNVTTPATYSIRALTRRRSMA